eukprot:5083151-Prymnesium_polylepis.1
MRCSTCCGIAPSATMPIIAVMAAMAGSNSSASSTPKKRQSAATFSTRDMPWLLRRRRPQDRESSTSLLD